MAPALVIAGIVEQSVQRHLGKQTFLGATVTDNGANYYGASRLLSDGDFQCLAHTAQLCVKDVFGEAQPRVDIESVKVTVIHRLPCPLTDGL